MKGSFRLKAVWTLESSLAPEEPNVYGNEQKRLTSSGGAASDFVP
jgi:hypothetical protein